MTDQGEKLEACTLAACPPGPFECNGYLGFKTEYGAVLPKDEGGGKVTFHMSNRPDAYVMASGEWWVGGWPTNDGRDAQIVQPIDPDELQDAWNRRTPPVGAGGLSGEVLARLDKAIDGLQPLTGYGEDAVWRPSNRAWKALVEARTILAALSEAQAIQPQDRTAAGSRHPTPPDGPASSGGQDDALAKNAEARIAKVIELEEAGTCSRDTLEVARNDRDRTLIALGRQALAAYRAKRGG
jgi:hypothetical protein